MDKQQEAPEGAVHGAETAAWAAGLAYLATIQQHPLHGVDVPQPEGVTNEESYFAKEAYKRATGSPSVLGVGITAALGAAAAVRLANRASAPSTPAGEAEAMAEVERLRAERLAICQVLGCVDKPGVPLRFVENLRREVSQLSQRNGDLHRMWDPATPTERQELDRFRRGWGPSSPTERMRRQDDIAFAMRVLSSAMTTLSVTEEDVASGKVPDESIDYLDAAGTEIEKAYDKLNATLHQIRSDPPEWPDIKAAEERGAAAAEAALASLRAEREVDRQQVVAAFASICEARGYEALCGNPSGLAHHLIAAGKALGDVIAPAPARSAQKDRADGP